jgi:hypothetical protein
VISKLLPRNILFENVACGNQLCYNAQHMGNQMNKIDVDTVKLQHALDCNMITRYEHDFIKSVFITQADMPKTSKQMDVVEQIVPKLYDGTLVNTEEESKKNAASVGQQYVYGYRYEYDPNSTDD